MFFKSEKKETGVPHFKAILPPPPTEREMLRRRLMREIEEWDEIDKTIAAQHAQILKDLLDAQFKDAAWVRIEGGEIKLQGKEFTSVLNRRKGE